MNLIEQLQSTVQYLGFPPILIVGLITVMAFYVGRQMKYIKLPQLIGYMVFGVLLGPSLFNLVTPELQQTLGFINEIALSFVAVSIGLELHFISLKRLGRSIFYIIFLESFGAFILVFGSLYLLTGDLALSLIFGAVAPASAPAGTVAIIQEFKAKGNLTKALYAVVGFDDGLGIIIFGFVAAFSRSILAHQTGATELSTIQFIWVPLKEIIFSAVLGVGFGYIFCRLARKLKNPKDILILVFGMVLIISGLCKMLHLSIILTNMILGMLIVNTQPKNMLLKISQELRDIMPLLFILFFTMAGTSLHLAALPSLGLLGIIYIISRSGGLILGAKAGAIIGKAEENIRKYLGFGILSQAGVAIGLSLIVKHDFRGMGAIISAPGTPVITEGDHIGSIVLTTITATCIIFEIIGPILTKWALKNSGEITLETPEKKNTTKL